LFFLKQRYFSSPFISAKIKTQTLRTNLATKQPGHQTTMREHAVPQNVTSYEFHLIGNMTLKQFLEVAAGVVAGVLVYQTNLPDIVKWPIIIFTAALGAMIAFVPYEGRPLDQWFIALIRAIYKPTEFYWQKTDKVPEYFTYSQKGKTITEEEFDLTPIKQRRIAEYITTLSEKKNPDPLEQLEQSRLYDVMSLFDQVQVSQVIAQEQFEKPDLTISTHTLQPYSAVFEMRTPPSQVPERISADEIPENIPVEIEAVQEEVPAEILVDETLGANAFSTSFQTSVAPEDTQSVQTSTTLPFPKKPTQPNIVVGMIFDKMGGIVDNAIIEITDAQGMPVRAVKTNRIGQFFISTPLRDGEYYIQVEKSGMSFPVQQLTLQQTLLDPLEMRES